jgi:hypothetical protein
MPTAFRIGPVEDKLLTFLARYVWATLAQCTRYDWSPNSARHVRRYLQALAAADYVQQTKGFAQTTNVPLVYSPTLRAWRYAEEHYDLPAPRRWRPSEAQWQDYNDYRHALAITDFGLALERFARTGHPYVRLIRSIHDRMLPQSLVTLPDGKTRQMRLDHFFELRLKRSENERPKQRCHLVEIDRGTHYETRLREKLVSQIAYARSGGYQADFGTQSLTYLWVCPGLPERALYLRKLTETVLTELNLPDFAPLFAFTGENPAKCDPVGLFIKPVWFVPYASEPTALLTALPEPRTVRLSPSQYLPQEQYDQFLLASGEDVPAIAAERDVE